VEIALSSIICVLYLADRARSRCGDSVVQHRLCIVLSGQSKEHMWRQRCPASFVCVLSRQSKEQMWRQVETALSSVTANELLSAVCALAHETATALSLKTAAIDIARDAEKLRYGICICSRLFFGL